jgi:hypothetical protein
LSTNNRRITYRDVQTILSRLEFLERHAAQIVNSSRSASSYSARSSPGDFSRTASEPTSPVGSTISELYLPPPVGHAELFFSPTRSPPPIPYAGSLSISTDYDPPSPVDFVNTPSPSVSSSPPLFSQQRTRGRTGLEAPEPAVHPASVQRRPITSDTDCAICTELIENAADAVWCRGTCGQNLHIECFGEWRTFRDDDDNLLCIYWYVLAYLLLCITVS